MPSLEFSHVEGNALYFIRPQTEAYPPVAYCFRRASNKGSTRGGFKMFFCPMGEVPAEPEVSYSRYLGDIEHPSGNTILETDFSHWLGKQRRKGRWLIEVAYLSAEGEINRIKRTANGSPVSIAQYYHAKGIEVDLQHCAVCSVQFLDGPNHKQGLSKEPRAHLHY